MKIVVVEHKDQVRAEAAVARVLLANRDLHPDAYAPLFRGACPWTRDEMGPPRRAAWRRAVRSALKQLRAEQTYDRSHVVALCDSAALVGVVVRPVEKRAGTEKRPPRPEAAGVYCSACDARLELLVTARDGKKVTQRRWCSRPLAGGCLACEPFRAAWAAAGWTDAEWQRRLKLAATRPPTVKKLAAELERQGFAGVAARIRELYAREDSR